MDSSSLPFFTYKVAVSWGFVFDPLFFSFSTCSQSKLNNSQDFNLDRSVMFMSIWLSASQIFHLIFIHLHFQLSDTFNVSNPNTSSVTALYSLSLNAMSTATSYPVSLAMPASHSGNLLLPFPASHI